ncbi:hypothetical protein SAMN02745229_00285 [Butyrivibrio fibrisolvens DSM 3071]|uniref:DUF5105 domain-containing protein n=1 Tax=Butyrivibrio fibrisolvens DSM 3071 TaxID=1121131 RepID=A0A1M5QE34_BUTFI|nr:hypothetical protein [Butyrivibrio fibrisolvens]SHH12228.1 hypothetical protein SAMN02745229_00285 [Butyrivibrio fibrisolvens DSM 3071]
MKKIKAILLISAAIGAAAAFTGCGKQKVDLNSFIKVESEGYDGYGNASYSVDTESLEAALASIVDSDSNIQSLENLMSGELDKTESLSNGDTVTFTWSISENQKKNIEDELGIDIVYESLESTIEGLPNYVKTVDEIPQSVLDVMLEKSDKVIADMQTDEATEAEYCGKALYEHKNFDSYKVHTIAVLETENGSNIVLIIYELHFSVHGDVTTYYPTAFTYIKDSDEGLESSDISLSDWRAFITTKVGDYTYYGHDSIDEFKSGTLDWWINILPYGFDQATGNYDYKEY